MSERTSTPVVVDATGGTDDGSEAVTIRYPSAQFPGPPTVSLDLPQGWAPVRVSGALMAARRIDSDAAFAPNVVVRGYVRDDAFTMAEAIEELRAEIESRPEGTVDAPFEIEIRDVPFVGVNVAWVDPGLGQVVQVHLFSGAARSRRVDLVQLTGSVCGEGAIADYDIVRGILESAVIGR